MNPSTTQPARTAPPAGAPAFASVGLGRVGSGGDGIVLLGNLLLEIAAGQGLYGVLVLSYGPQIRGGESAAVLRLATGPVQYEGDEVDLLLCFRAADVRRFEGHIRLHPGSGLILEANDTGPLPAWLGDHEKTTYRYPFARLENGIEVPGEPRNMLGLGLVCRALGFSDTLAHEALRARFGHRPEALARNLAAFDRAYGAADAPPSLPALPVVHGEAPPRVVETGNEAIARAAIASGLRFFAGYPITPSSEIMETLLEEMPPGQGPVVQAEDEIAALGMVLGASFGGCPAMTATSGPGLSLMTEMMGLSSMAELPAVIVDCQRAGPATGMPSRTEQADLWHALFAGHGDFPRCVLGVFDVVHAHEVTNKAFRLAEGYQLPVLVLSDAYIAQRTEVHDPVPAPAAVPARRTWAPGDPPRRFEIVDVDKGVGAFRVPGTAEGTYMAAGIEHTLEGNPTADGPTHHAMNAKRFAKLDAIAKETRDWVRTLGPPGARRGIVAWGSQYGMLREWLPRHPDYRAFLPEILDPFPLAAFEEWVRDLDWLAVVELSFQGQLHRYLAGLTDLRGALRVARSGGMPLTWADLSRLLGEEQP
jgi:2-oxoglutarate ferredoxin oxidoreductase subunit alpha